jgi:hypothetical protein
MKIAVVRRVVAVGLLGATFLGFPAIAAAVITPPCSGSGHAASGDVDLGTATEWHLKSTDTVVGEGSSTVPMKSATVSAYAFGGLSIPIAGGSGGEGLTEGSVNGVLVSQYAILGARFYVAGSASGDGGATCAGSIVIIIDNVSPAATVLGGGALAAAAIGLLGILLGTRLSGRTSTRVFVGIVGLLGGIGAAVAAAQFGILDPTQPIGLVLPVIGAVAGFGLCGTLRSKPPMVSAPA